MLAAATITAFVPTVDPQRAKEFYMNVLGLQLVSEDNYALVFEGNGVTLRITSVEKFNPQPFAVLGFGVRDIRSEVEALIGKGIVFERYGSMEQDDLGIWTAPSRAKITWFKDPDGNVLSLTESAS